MKWRAVKTYPLVSMYGYATLFARFYGQPYDGRMAKSIGTGASWRTGECAGDARCRRRCCIRARSTTRSRRDGVKQLVRVEEAFRNLKGDPALRPIYHQTEGRVEAHIFVAFLAYCLQVTLAQRLKAHASGLTPRSVIEQTKAMQMLDVRVPTTDGRWLHMARYTQPDKTQQLLLARLGLNLPPQQLPKITTREVLQNAFCGEDLDQ